MARQPDPVKSGPVRSGFGPVHSEPVPDSFSSGPRDPHWYKRAVFYEVVVRGFHDSNGDGTGDLQGLTSRLDYLQWLGIDCIWLLPIYASPLRDGGYDISDFMTILPDFGHIGHFVEMVDEAHARGIRVIADLVMNHTSDQHPWFQASRRDPDGPYGDFYVWSDNDDKYTRCQRHLRRHRAVKLDLRPGPRPVLLAQVLLPPTRSQLREPQGRGGDARGAAVLARPRLDGFRLDAVPYLYEREGTNCENLKETHEYLKRARRSRPLYTRPRPARRGQPVAGRRGRVLRRPATSATWRFTSR